MWRYNHGDREVLRRIYEKYKDGLLTLATALTSDSNLAEDVLHDTFAHFITSCGKSRLTKSLKGYLSTCLANNARDMASLKQRRQGLESGDGHVAPVSRGPDICAMLSEELESLSRCLAELPYEQREVISLHLFGGMKFRAIAGLQGVSINTVQGRYRYGLNKLRSILNGQMEK
jgi:RNA polymerase sigma-70 factor (ECF subfamily)